MLDGQCMAWSSRRLFYTQPPTPIRFFQRRLPIVLKFGIKSFQRLLPSHDHTSLALGLSCDFYSHSSWFTQTAFLFATKTLYIAGYESASNLHGCNCHLC